MDTLIVTGERVYSLSNARTGSLNRPALRGKGGSMIELLFFAGAILVIFVMGWQLGSWRGYEQGRKDEAIERRMRGR